MTATTPFFSIITATCNAAETLPILLASLSEQHCRDFELVVQDARSSDGTLALLERASGIPAIELLSERDSGIYDAWNRAVARARGQWLLFLGSDDRLSDADVLGKTAGILRQTAAGICFAAGSVRMLDARGQCRLQSTPVLDGGPERMRHIAPAGFPGLFIRKELATANPFDTDLRISADYDFLCRTWADEKAITLPYMVAVMLEGGISSRPENQFSAAWENARVAARHFSGVWTPRRARMLCKAGLVSSAFRLLGPDRGATLLDTLRRWRGLPPCWKRDAS